MFCVASKTQQEMWELSTRHADHNHTPYEPPAPKKKGSWLTCIHVGPTEVSTPPSCSEEVDDMNVAADLSGQESQSSLPPRRVCNEVMCHC